jgi:hypothetical protein
MAVCISLSLAVTLSASCDLTCFEVDSIGYFALNSATSLTTSLPVI